MSYQEFPLILSSKGIAARNVLDQPPGQSFFLNLENCEELAENSIGTRLGSILVNGPYALPSGVYSLARLTGLNGNAYRYAGAGGNLYRRSSLTPGQYTKIASGMSGQPFTTAIFNPAASSYPYAFFADLSGMLKDNGSFAAPQQWGIFQPQYPVQAQAQAPDQIILDNYTGSAGGYTYTGIGTGTIGTAVSTTTTAAVAIGVNSVNVAAPKQLQLFQVLTVDSGGNQETVLVIGITPGGFTANFTKAHASGVTVTSSGLSVTVPASTTGSLSKSFAGTPIAAWPVTLDQADYIGLQMYVSDPAQIQKIILSFDCGDGTFQSDYFYRIIGQGPLQTLLDTNTDSSTSAADAVLSETLGLYTSENTGITQLQTGLSQWSGLLMQLSDFAGAGRADFNDQVFNWSNVNGYQITIVTNDNTSVTVKFAGLVLFGGAGPDSFAGVSYDFAATFYNANDGTESNPSMFMTNVNPPFQTNWVTPRRQPVNLSVQTPVIDPQVTHMRWYSRGGTFGDNFRRIDQVPIAQAAVQTYTDIWSDAEIEAGDILSLVNDVPVTSTLPTPVNTTLTAAIATLNQVVTITPASMAGISVRQQVDIGNVVAPNFEVVIVLSVTPTTFTAFVQNTHAAGETVAATAAYGQPVQLIAQAFGQMYFAGDKNNPSYLYYSAADNPQAVGSANYVAVSTPDDPITAIVATRANLFVSTVKRWWSISPGTNAGQAPIVYPTAADRGCIAIGGVCVKGEVVAYQAIDGIRFFTGGGSTYMTQNIEFLFQGVGETPIVEADQTQLGQTVMTWWNEKIFVSYVGTDGGRHRVIYDLQYQRWRNDDVPAESILLEQESNALLYGDSNGLIHQDRIDQAYDQGEQNGQIVQVPIDMTLQTYFNDQGKPTQPKQYNDFTLDANTQGVPVYVTLVFDDGESSLYLGTVTTTQRNRVNLDINDGLGISAYKVSLKLTATTTKRIMLFQAALSAFPLAITRTSYDSYWIDCGTADSKLAKNFFADYQSTTSINVTVFYDAGSASNSFQFTLPSTNGAREVFRQRLPAVKFRLVRVVMDSGGTDFQLWGETKLEVKPVKQGSGWEAIPLASLED